MRGSPLALLSGLIVLLPMAPLAGAEIEPPAALESGLAGLEIEGARGSIPYSRTAFGALVALQPLTARLGGELEVGPLGAAHTLTLEGSVYRFGPDSPALTKGDEIVSLSQPPRVASGGLHVPLDLLEQTYGVELGFEFRWRGDGQHLEVVRVPARDLQVSLDLVHLQGVSTVVLQFPERPRYRLEHKPGEVVVALLGDRLRFDRRPVLPPGGLVRGIDLGSSAVRLRLGPGAVAEEYTLDRPFRLVFDVYRGAAVRPARAELTPPRRRTGGIQTIAIDPGHGGSDTGARGPRGTLEKDLTLELARRLQSQLARRLPVRTILTRREDAELPLDTRTALANQQKADLLISIHLNASPGGGGQGAETYYASLEASDERAAQAAAAANAGDPLSDLQLILWDLAQSHYLVESQRLAALIQEELNETLELRNRGVKQAPFRVLMGAAMPAVLVELGFLSNPREEERLSDPLYRDRLVDSLVEAVARYRAQRQPAAEPVADETLR